MNKVTRTSGQSLKSNSILQKREFNLNDFKTTSYRKLFLIIILFSTFTNSFVIFAKLTGVPFSIITSVFFAIQIVFIRQEFYLLINKGRLINIFLIIVVTPLTITLFTGVFSFYYFSLSLYYFSIYLIGGVSVIRYPQQLKLSLIFALIFNGLFGVLSMFKPEFFTSIGEVIGYGHIQGGRAFAFFYQTNLFGLTLILFFITSILLFKQSNINYISFFVVIITFATGSRTAISILILLLLFFNFLYFNKNIKKVKKLFKSILQIFFGVILLITISFILYEPLFKTDKSFDDLTSRIDFLFNLNESELGFDESWATRQAYQHYHYNSIENNILFGKGIDSQFDGINKGILGGSSHNLFIDLLYQGGVILLLSYFALLVIIFRDSIKCRTNFHIRFILGNVLLLYLIVAPFFSGDLLTIRPLYITLGVLFFSDNKYSAKIFA